MEKSIQQTVEERRAYVNQVRSSFQTEAYRPQRNYPVSERKTEETQYTPSSSTLGLRTVIAIFIFAAFVYCDKENISWHDYTTEEVFSQIEWNPLPVEDMEKYMGAP